MIVSGINRILNWCQVISGGRRYTCSTKMINGELFFFFKKQWHPVKDYIFDHAQELVEEGGRIFTRVFKG